MVGCLERIGRELAIRDTVMGATISAAGTSIPNYIASQVAARQGFANMAISSAIGSSTFNILVGLGLPWVLWTMFSTGDLYNELKDDKITLSVMIMAGVHLVFIVVLISSGFELRRWHAFLFFALYGVFVLFTFVQTSYI